MRIPEYPVFRPLELEDKAVLDDAFKRNPPENSEYTFTNLYCWRQAHGFSLSRMEDLLILSSQERGARAYYPPIGPGDAHKAVIKILLDTGGRFVRVPEQMKFSFDKDPLIHAVEDRDNADYLFLAQDLIRLEGRKFDGKRNFIRNFRSKYQYEYVTVTADVVPEVLRFQDVWCVEKGCSQSKSLLDEGEAVKIMLGHFVSFSLKAGALRVGGRICAVCIAEALNADTLVIHVFKGAHGMAGIYPTVFNEFLSREAYASRFINMEQDLGIAGLRKSKESYQPVRLVRKFTLSLVDEKVRI
ncbi:MAG: phosphatidylglycerol lysyltransferase domain-containing protein [Candidatus Omnitrophota bacterium]